MLRVKLRDLITPDLELLKILTDYLKVQLLYTLREPISKIILNSFAGWRGGLGAEPPRKLQILKPFSGGSFSKSQRFFVAPITARTAVFEDTTSLFLR